MTADSGQPSADNAGRVSKDPLSDAISAAFDATTETPAKEPVKVEEVSAKGPETESAGDDRDGEDAATSGEPSKLTEAKDEKAPPAPKLSEPPKHWAAADKQAFAALPEEAKAVLLKLSKNLEGGFTRKSQELSDKGRFADSVRGLFGDSERQQMAQSGMDEAGAIQYLIQTQRFASQQPVEYVKWAMQTLGVTPDHLGISQASGEPAVSGAAQGDAEIAALLADPAVKQMEAKLAAMEARFAEKERQEQEYQHQQRISSVNSIKSQIGEFRSALDETGQLKYPHFDTVQRHMGALMDTDPDLAAMPDGQDKLAAAYEAAINSRPDLRASLIEAEVARRLQEQEKRLAAEKARRATAVKPAAGVVTSKSKASNLDDAIASSMSKLGL